MGQRLTRAFRMLDPYVKHLRTSHFTSFILCLLYAILSTSIPTFNNMDITRINYNSTQVNETGGIDQIRVCFFSRTTNL